MWGWEAGGVRVTIDKRINGGGGALGTLCIFIDGAGGWYRGDGVGDISGGGSIAGWRAVIVDAANLETLRGASLRVIRFTVES